MTNDAQELLMMFIRDAYSSSGKISKSTAIKMMRFAGNNEELQNHVNNACKKSILSFRVKE